MLKYRLSQINTVSKKILPSLSNNDCIFLLGELGSGKTTFARSLIHQLQEKNKIEKTEVLSPTFNLLYEYEIKSNKVMHYDLYRLETEKEIDQLGIFQNQKNSIILVEWPEKIRTNIKDKLEISFFYEKDSETRKIDFKGFGKWKDFKLDEI
tara:strand:- start:1668 stop:2123 length:456 start_codon:yes stop_codon:yes gene_type:complete